MIDPEEALFRGAAGHRHLPAFATAALPATRYVHVDADWSAVVLCSSACVASRARRPAGAVGGATAPHAAAAADPHPGQHLPDAARRAPRPGGSRAPRRRRLPAPRPRAAAAAAGLVRARVAADGDQPARRRWAATPGFIRCPGRCGACRARDSRVFGAVRPGERPAECRNGHCGVDLGGEIWGEQVHAVHDGVVDCVQRTPTPIAAASSCASPIATAPCSRSTSTWRRSRAGSSAACTSRAATSSGCSATPA